MQLRDLGGNEDTGTDLSAEMSMGHPSAHATQGLGFMSEMRRVFFDLSVKAGV